MPLDFLKAVSWLKMVNIWSVKLTLRLGQFMRAYVQRCNRPAVRNLVTFGSQHMGISDFPACKPADFLCRLAEGALRSGVYSDYSQSHIVTAQYFRNPKERTSYDKYLEANHFLADINNENNFNETYKTNLQSLDNLVLLMFDQDLVSVASLVDVLADWLV